MQSRFLSSLTPQEKASLLYRWSFWARDNQLPPDGDWAYWVVLAGRGFGKTRTGAEWVRGKVGAGYGRIALVGPTAADARDVMIEGESGLLAVCPPWDKPLYEPSKRRVTWPNGAIATAYSADEPDRLRGPQHDAAWCDEIAAWRYPEAWDMLMFGLRLGDNPQALATTTPKRVKVLKDLLADPNTVVTGGSTFENKANLAPSFIHRIVRKYEGTRLGRQELHAHMLDDNPGALWNRPMLDDRRVREHPPLVLVVVAIDPSVTNGEDSAETGIVVVGLGNDGHGYVLDDLSGQYAPADWAKQAVTAFWKYRANRIVAETNNGGDMVGLTVATIDWRVPFQAVTASRGKYTRAEPVSTLYEQGRVHHVGSFPELEDQLCEWVPGSKSPDRLDALVWAVTSAMLTLDDSDADDEEYMVYDQPVRISPY